MCHGLSRKAGRPGKNGRYISKSSVVGCRSSESKGFADANPGKIQAVVGYRKRGMRRAASGKIAVMGGQEAEACAGKAVLPLRRRC